MMLAAVLRSHLTQLLRRPCASSSHSFLTAPNAVSASSPPDVFVAYRYSDGAKVAWALSRHLEGHGLRVFCDQTLPYAWSSLENVALALSGAARHFVLIATDGAVGEPSSSSSSSNNDDKRRRDWIDLELSASRPGGSVIAVLASPGVTPEAVRARVRRCGRDVDAFVDLRSASGASATTSSSGGGDPTTAAALDAVAQLVARREGAPLPVACGGGGAGKPLLVSPEVREALDGVLPCLTAAARQSLLQSRGDPSLRSSGRGGGGAALRAALRRAVAVSHLRPLGAEADNPGGPLLPDKLTDSLSLRELPVEWFATSQGFVVLPVYHRQDAQGRLAEFVRLHSWHDGPPLRGHFTKPELAIHSHQLSLRSWVMEGALADESFAPAAADTPGGGAEFAMFDIEWDGTKVHTVGHRATVAVNTGATVRVEAAGRRVHAAGTSYVIPAGALHRSGVARGLLQQAQPAAAASRGADDPPSPPTTSAAAAAACSPASAATTTLVHMFEDSLRRRQTHAVLGPVGLQRSKTLRRDDAVMTQEWLDGVLEGICRRAEERLAIAGWGGGSSSSSAGGGLRAAAAGAAGGPGGSSGVFCGGDSEKQQEQQAPHQQQAATA